MSAPFYEWVQMRCSIELPWCVVVTQAGREQAVQAELALAGWSTYLPMQTTTTGNRQRRRKVNRPLFSRYLFAALNEGGNLAAPASIEGLVAVHRCTAIKDGVEVPRTAVRTDLLARLMMLEANHGFDLTYEKPKSTRAFVCGEPVKVRAGTMRGMDALILKVLSEREVVITLQVSLAGTDEVRLNPADLEAA